MIKGFRLVRCRITMQAGESGLDYPIGRDMVLGKEIEMFFYKHYCLYPEKSCHDCFKRYTCFYASAFEPASVVGSLPARMASRIPHYFVIMPPGDSKNFYKPEEEVTFVLYLFGKGIASLSFFLEGFKAMGKEGIDSGRKKLFLKECSLEHPLTEASLPLCMDGSGLSSEVVMDGEQVEEWAKAGGNISSLKVHFRKPTVIRHQDGYLKEPQFAIILNELLTRVASIFYFYHNRKEFAYHHQDYLNRAEKVELLKDKTRFVSAGERDRSQQQKHGFLGKATYKGELSAFLPFLKLGEYINLGEGAHLGRGQFRLVSSGIYPL